ncbi:MAG: adenylate kinase [Dehalococcoidia bacterium]
MNVILLGPPGAGKGTQARKIVDEFDFDYISTGDMLRKEVQSESRLGKIAKSYMNNGDLVPDSYIVEMIVDNLGELNTKNLIDGFPRNISQAEALSIKLTENQQKIAVVLHMNVDDEELINRLSTRAVCVSCQNPIKLKFPEEILKINCENSSNTYCDIKVRDDDNPKSVARRITVYKNETFPVVKYYKDLNVNLVDIDARGTEDEIFEEISKFIAV